MLRKNICNFIIVQIFLLLLQVNSAGAQQLYHKDLEITESQFVSVYNAALDLISQKTGRNCNDLKINPQNFHYNHESDGTTTGKSFDCKRCQIEFFKNTPDSENICGVFIYGAGNITKEINEEEIVATAIAVSSHHANFENVLATVQTILKTLRQNFSAKSVDELVVAYAIPVDGMIIAYGYQHMIFIVEDAQNREAEILKYNAKKDGYWNAPLRYNPHKD